MKRILILVFTTILTIVGYAQKVNVVGTWHEQGMDRTWIFAENGTKTLKGRQKLTYPLGGVNCTFDLVQTRTDAKWTLNGHALTCVSIPLNNFSIDVDYQKYGNYTSAQKQKINAAIPAFKQLAIKEARRDWQSFVGHKAFYIITSYSPKQMVLNLDGERFVLVRDISKMTAAQKAAFNKDVAEYEAKIQKEKEKEEKAKREAEEKAKREAEEKARREAEEKAKIENQYWEILGAEKKASADKAAAQGYRLVDLGLSVRWADRNLGALNETDKGDYYAWGETKPSDGKAKYKPVMKPKKGAVLDSMSDPATVHLGTGWHVPTIEQWKELFARCTMKESDDHKGVIFTGPNGNTIFFPFTNYQYWAHYWANSDYHGRLVNIASIPRQAPTSVVAGYTLKSSDTPKTGTMFADHLLPVRAVME